jgi:glycerol-3-phosphate cytidylyltransferase
VKIGFTASTFDLLHAGHIAMLSEAKTVCNYLVAGLHVNPNLEREEKNLPVQTLVERYTQLKAVSYVDEIIPYESENDLMDILKMYPINIRIIGEEYRDKDFTGKNLDMEIYYNKRRHDFSSSLLRERVVKHEQFKVKLQVNNVSR